MWQAKQPSSNVLPCLLAAYQCYGINVRTESSQLNNQLLPIFIYHITILRQ